MGDGRRALGLADRLGPQGGVVKSAVVSVTVEPPVDREKTCPFLLRMFPKLGSHHVLEEFGRPGRGKSVLRQVGTVHGTRVSPDDIKTLKRCNFQIGDFLDVAIY
ncbi:hypothetical protein QBZ16_004136 [Prototheca wickerhamii]|uniref:Uncharacterized protein n=1 Tax=Prototheca wickerhamii TaxID=3111 RepID=A0AAD9ILP9_PROWI|nr:hypothetical protein QBZ16_004136 [Prototheca wickerhamii]